MENCTAQIRMPRPISTNNLFANVKGRGRVTSSTYNAWRWQAKAMMQDQKPLPKFAGPVAIRLYVGEKGVSANFDADNCAKAYLDALVHEGVIQDDSRRHVRSILVRWVPDQEGCIAAITDSEDDNWMSIRGLSRDMVQGQVG